MNILLTGAAGFIGSSLAKELLATSHQLRAFLRYNSRADIGLFSPSHQKC